MREGMENKQVGRQTAAAIIRFIMTSFVPGAL